MHKIIIFSLILSTVIISCNVFANDYTYDRFNKLQDSMQQHMSNYETYDRRSKMFNNDNSMQDYYERQKAHEMRDLKEDMEDMDRLRKYGF